MPRVKSPAAYQGPTRGQALVEVDGATVGSCIDAVEDRFPGFRAQVVDAEGRVHRFVNLFVNGDELDRGKALEAPVEESDEVEVLAAIGGG